MKYPTASSDKCILQADARGKFKCPWLSALVKIEKGEWDEKDKKEADGGICLDIDRNTGSQPYGLSSRSADGSREQEHGI